MLYRTIDDVDILKSENLSIEGGISCYDSKATLVIPEDMLALDGVHLNFAGGGLPIEGITLHRMMYVLVKKELRTGTYFHAEPFNMPLGEKVQFRHRFLWADGWAVASICGYPIPIHD